MRRLLSKEKVDEGLDYKELATMTEGYSGSDLKVSSMKHECTNMPPLAPAHPKRKTKAPCSTPIYFSENTQESCVSLY